MPVDKSANASEAASFNKAIQNSRKTQPSANKMNGNYISQDPIADDLKCVDRTFQVRLTSFITPNISEYFGNRPIKEVEV